MKLSAFIVIFAWGVLVAASGGYFGYQFGYTQARIDQVKKEITQIEAGRRALEEE